MTNLRPLLLLTTILVLNGQSQGLDPKVLEAIREEAIKPSNSPNDRPLPLAGHWHTGTTVKGFGPAYQRKLIERGEYFIPWFIIPQVTGPTPGPGYYEEMIKLAAEYHLPIVLVGTQWERLLSSEAEFYKLPPGENPNVVKVDGNIDRTVSPFGPIDPWRKVGLKWGSHPMLRQIQEWYPDPPRVIFLSNNEHSKLRWHNVEDCKAYIDQYGKGRPEELKRQVVAEGWIPRYRALHQGIRDGLISEVWKKNAIFIGYNAFNSPSIGRWPAWHKNSLHFNEKLSVWPMIWNGCSMPYYTHPWDGSTDCNVWSAQVEAMNWVAGMKLLPSDQDFWFELSTWDGNVPGKPNDKRLQYEKAGQSFSPERYGGMVQYGMWLLRPRSVREFRSHNETLPLTDPYFIPILEAVKRVHRTPELADFWRRGELVANHSRPHPYQTNLPPVLEKVDRWFRLDTSLDPKEKWRFHSELKIFALALVQGTYPDRQWLLYAHAPMGAQSKAQIQIPDYSSVTVDVPLGGGFWIIDEKTKGTRMLP